MKRVRTADLHPGMITAEDVYSYNNQMIVPKNSVLDDKIITRLEFYSVLAVRISEAEDIVDEPSTTDPNSGKSESAPQSKRTEQFEISENSSYSQKIRSSKQFKDFEKNFLSTSESFSKTLHSIVDGNVEINPKELMSAVTSLIKDDMTPSGVFDMLHNMRQYDDFTYMHSMNVALIANVFAQWLHLGDEDKEILTVGGLLHDIGKLKVPDDIIHKPSKLTPEEYNIIKTHTLQGYNVLKESNLDGRIKECALMHHERCDGTGYPLGLMDENISPYAKILAICDVYDAMTAARIYRGPLCPFHVVGIFESEGLLKYDGKFLLTFLEHVALTYMNNRVRLSNGLEGEIVFMNKNQYSRPMVQTPDGFIDLSKSPSIYIETFV